MTAVQVSLKEIVSDSGRHPCLTIHFKDSLPVASCLAMRKEEGVQIRSGEKLSPTSCFRSVCLFHWCGRMNMDYAETRSLLRSHHCLLEERCYCRPTRVTRCGVATHK